MANIESKDKNPWNTMKWIREGNEDYEQILEIQSENDKKTKMKEEIVEDEEQAFEAVDLEEALSEALKEEDQE